MEILKSIISKTEDYKIVDYKIGNFITFIESKNYGVSSTLATNNLTENLLNKSTKEISNWIFSDDLLKASVGMASINSSLIKPDYDFHEANGFELIKEKGLNKNIGVIGHFPFVERLKNIANDLYVFELNPKEGDIHSDYLDNYIDDIDVLAITGTTLINHTFEKVMRNVKNDCYVVLLGPSVPLTDVFFDFKINVVSGAFISDKETFLNSMNKGTNFRSLEGKKYFTIIKK